MIQEILNREFNLIKSDIIKAYDRKNMRASGKFADSLHTEQSVNEVKLIGKKYAEQLEYGRRKTGVGVKPSKKFVKKIKEWVLARNIVSNSQKKISTNSLAYLIARKIHQKGWNRKDRGGVGLISEIVTPQRIKKIIDMIGIYETKTLVFKLEKEMKLWRQV